MGMVNLTHLNVCSYRLTYSGCWRVFSLWLLTFLLNLQWAEIWKQRRWQLHKHTHTHTPLSTGCHACSWSTVRVPSECRPRWTHSERRADQPTRSSDVFNTCTNFISKVQRDQKFTEPIIIITSAKEVMLLSLCVRLSVCQQQVKENYRRILMKFLQGLVVWLARQQLSRFRRGIFEGIFTITDSKNFARSALYWQRF